MRILIADADQNFLESFQSYMWECGHDAEFATNGLECSAILYRFTPDVLIMDRDLLWGGCDGILAKLRDKPELSEIPVVILASTSQDPVEDISSPNVVAWMQKPCHMRDTLEQVLSAVGPLQLSGQTHFRERMPRISRLMALAIHCDELL